MALNNIYDHNDNFFNKRVFVILIHSDSPSMASRGTVLSLSKVEPLINSEYLELISNPGSAKGSRNVSPTPLLGKEIQAFKPVENGLTNFSYENSLDMEQINDVDSEGLSALHRAVRVGDVVAVVALLDKGADINVIGKSGLTPLHAAVRYVPFEGSSGEGAHLLPIRSGLGCGQVPYMG